MIASGGKPGNTPLLHDPYIYTKGQRKTFASDVELRVSGSPIRSHGTRMNEFKLSQALHIAVGQLAQAKTAAAAVSRGSGVPVPPDLGLNLEFVSRSEYPRPPLAASSLPLLGAGSRFTAGPNHHLPTGIRYCIWDPANMILPRCTY